jgi:uncharacterized delta-60 repeat protein
MKLLFLALGVVSLGCGGRAMDSDAYATPEGEEDAPFAEEESELTARCACAPGTLDPTFGPAGTGITRLSIGPDDAGGFFALDRRGNTIVAAGSGLGGLGGSTFKVARLLSNGTPDAAFGGGAVVRTQWGSSTNDYAYARAVGRQSSGRVVAIGSFEHGPRRDVALARYNTNGTLDTSFGADGKPLLDLGGAEVIEGGLVRTDGSILAVGSRDGQVLVARFTQNGVVDTSFAGGTGYFTTALGDSSTAASVALDRLGRIVVAGSASVGGQSDVLLLRLSRNGALDTSFGAGGHVLVGDPSIDERAVAIAVMSNGKIVVAGDAGSGNRDFLVRRFRANGSPDPTFGTGGVVTAPITGGDDRVESMALTRAGRVLVVGNSIGGSASGPVAARYTAAGALDSSFGAGGVAVVDIGEFGILHTVRIDARGMALLGGGDEGASPGPGTFVVVARMCM